MKNHMELSESLEDYLEAILDLERTCKVARTKDIAEKLDIKPGSVTGALRVLGEKGLINYSPYSYITLTPQGESLALESRRRHETLKCFLHDILQIDNDTAEITACRMEHVIDPVSLERLVLFINFIQECPRTQGDWLANFIRHCQAKEGVETRHCVECLKQLPELTRE